jgi:hypothetical protein
MNSGIIPNGKKATILDKVLLWIRVVLFGCPRVFG